MSPDYVCVQAITLGVPACASEFHELVEGWRLELSSSSLCKVSSTGNLFPFPLDGLEDHPCFSGLDSHVFAMVRGLMCGLNHLYGYIPDSGLKLSHVQVKVCMFLSEVAKNFQQRRPRLPEMSWAEYMKVKTIDYKGDEVKAAQMTSWANVRSALPSEVGTVPLSSVVSKGSLHYVLNF